MQVKKQLEKLGIGTIGFAISIILIALSILGIVAYIQNDDSKTSAYKEQVGAYFSGIEDGDYVYLQYKNIQLSLEVAASESVKQKGLMNRDSLPPNTGMIFIYPSERPLTFWMKDTYIPLDIIFLDENLKVINFFERTEPNQQNLLYSSDRNAKFVIEVAGGWAKNNNLESGDGFIVGDIQY